MASQGLLLLLSILLVPLLVLADDLAADRSSRATTGSSSSSSSSYEARQCRLERISSNRPSRKIQSEGGLTELWDETEEELQCAGVAAMRNTIRPESLVLPHFTPSPILVYVEQGEGMIGFSVPGCPNNFHSGGESEYAARSHRHRREGGKQQRGEEVSMEDCHQKVHRIRKGDIVAVPAGVAHWCYNDADEDLVAFAVTDLNSRTNQLDQTPRSFFLAGGEAGSSGKRKAGGIQSSSIFRGLDPEMMSEAFNVDRKVIEKMQQEDDRGLIVKVQRGGMEMIKPTGRRRRSSSSSSRSSVDGAEEEVDDNGMDELFCNMRMHHNIDDPQEADVYSKRAGRLNAVNVFKLPILEFLGMSAERGQLRPRSMFAPHWTANAHTVVYVTGGEGRVEMVDDMGRTVCDERVEEGSVMVVPQNYVSVHKAGEKGMDWVSFKTSPIPVRTSVAGHASVFSALPVDVISNSYHMSRDQARDLKMSRMHQITLFPPTTTTTKSV